MSNNQLHCNLSHNNLLYSNSPCYSLPCFTLISTGYCPYNDRCLFIHDYRLICKQKTKLYRNKKGSKIIGHDSFFWKPCISNNNINLKLYNPEIIFEDTQDRTGKLWLRFIKDIQNTNK